MSEWKTYKLGDLIEINPKISLKQGQEYSFVEMKDLDATFKYVSPSTKKELKGGSKFQNGDTLFARITPCLENGKICQVKNLENNVGFGSTEFLVFRGRKNVSDSDFVYYLSRSEFVKNNAIQLMTGSSGRQRVEKSSLEELEIIIPKDIKTQKQIAQILTSLDDKIELNLQMNQTLEAMAQAIFKEWFVDFKFPGFDGEMVDGLPKGWQSKKLSDIIEIKHGFAFKGEFFSDFEEENILLTPGNFKIGGGFNSIKFKYYNGEIPKDYILERNDLVVTMTDLSKEGDTLGYSALVPTIEGKNILHNQRIGKVVFKNEMPLKFYLYWLMRQESYRHFVLGGATGSTVKHTSPTRICEYEFILPDKNTLSNFETIIKGLTDKQQENEFQIQTLTQTRDSLLPRLMSGKISLNL
jgi:type I restriction enzyme S subunit